MYWALVFVGGGAGALLRVAIQTALNQSPTFFLGTFLANILGSFVIGALFPLASQLPEWHRPLVVAGFLGAFTTMSTYSLEIANLIRDKHMTEAALHWAGGSVLCILACFAGIWLTQRFV